MNPAPSTSTRMGYFGTGTRTAASIDGGRPQANRGIPVFRCCRASVGQVHTRRQPRTGRGLTEGSSAPVRGGRRGRLGSVQPASTGPPRSGKHVFPFRLAQTTPDSVGFAHPQGVEGALADDRTSGADRLCRLFAPRPGRAPLPLRDGRRPHRWCHGTRRAAASPIWPIGAQEASVRRSRPPALPRTLLAP